MLGKLDSSWNTGRPRSHYRYPINTDRMNRNSQSLLDGRMEKRKKSARGPNWNHAHTLALAELKREASLNKEGGRQVWERIAKTLSSRFRVKIRGDQCQRRWETLVKVYNRIEDWRVVTGARDHRELDEGELASMKLATAYQQDWYDIVEEVCRQRKRKERGDRDLMLAKRIKGSHSVELPERPPNRDTLFSASTSKSVTHHDQSTTIFAQISSSSSLEADKLSPEEEVLRLKNGIDDLMLEQSTTIYAQVSSSLSSEADKMSPEEEVRRLTNGNDGFMLQATQLRQHGGEVCLESQTLNLQDYVWELVDDMDQGTSAEIEECETKSEVTEPIHWDLELVGLGSQPKEPLQDHVRDDSFETANVSSARFNDSRPPINYFGATAAANNSLSVFVFLGAWLYAAIMAPCRSADSTISRQSRRWSLKVILLKIHQYCHALGGKNRTEDMEMQSKQADRPKEKARKEALMPREENVPPMLDAASSTSATSATRGDKPLQKDTERICEPAALDKKEEEIMPLKAERQQLGGKSSTKCVPVGNLCELSRRLLLAFHSH